MESVINRILKIQNKHQSLKWGHHNISSDEVMFVVGHKEYPKEPQYFLLHNNTIYLLTDEHKKYVYKECDGEQSILSSVIELLKQWFPAKII